jgi:hypothetical protein
MPLSLLLAAGQPPPMVRQSKIGTPVKSAILKPVQKLHVLRHYLCLTPTLHAFPTEKTSARSCKNWLNLFTRDRTQRQN